MYIGNNTPYRGVGIPPTRMGFHGPWVFLRTWADQDEQGEVLVVDLSNDKVLRRLRHDTWSLNLGFNVHRIGAVG